MSEWLQTPYILQREDNKDARFYWMLDGKKIRKYIGITSLGSKVIPAGEELIKWQVLKDPDGRLLELSAEHGTLEHEVIDKLDRRMEWKPLLKDYKYERNILGAAISWIKFCDDYEIEVIASELMLKYEKGKKRFACTLDKVVWMTTTQKVKKEVEDGTYSRGAKKGQPKYKTITEGVKTKQLAIIDLKSNFFEKDSKSFYESHQFQLWGQRLAFMQTFPDMPEPLIFNWSPNNWRARTNGNLDNVYTLYEWRQDYGKKFNLLLQQAVLEDHLEPKGKIEVFDGFVNKETPLNEAYRVMDYDEYVRYRLAEQQKQETLESLKEYDLNTLKLMVDKDEVDAFINFNYQPSDETETEEAQTELRDFLIDTIMKNQENTKTITKRKAS